MDDIAAAKRVKGSIKGIGGKTDSCKILPCTHSTRLKKGNISTQCYLPQVPSHLHSMAFGWAKT